jgi:large subunit ribosomal protein L20
MTRVKRGNIARKRRKEILKITKSFRGASSVLFRIANQQRLKALKYSYRDRNQRKRAFRSLWITRINAAARNHDLCYNNLLHNLKKSNIFLNRKILSQLAICDPLAFTKLVSIVK